MSTEHRRSWYTLPMTSNVRILLLSLWVVAALVLGFLIAQPFLFKPTPIEILRSNPAAQVQADYARDIADYNTAIRAALKPKQVDKQVDRRVAFASVSSRFPQFGLQQGLNSASVRSISRSLAFTVNLFWVIVFNFKEELSISNEDYEIQASDPVLSAEDISEPSANALAIIFSVAGLLILLPLFVNLPTLTASPEEHGAMTVAEILYGQVRSAVDQVKFVRYMALFQLFAGVVVAFMGIVIFGVLFSLWASPTVTDDLHLLKSIQTSLDASARIALVSRLYGDNQANVMQDSIGQVLTLEARLAAAREPSDKQASHRIPDYGFGFARLGGGFPRPSDSEKPVPASIDQLLAAQKLLTSFAPVASQSRTFWDEINWPGLFRSMGILFFIEAVAWFLLQQYRRSMEDYKEFHRRSLKRSNYRAANEMASNAPLSRELLLVLTTLLTEELSGRLRAGETQDSVEQTKADNAAVNPIFGFFQSILTAAMPK